ncbi:MAG: substrate-binding periplasmic protein [Pseudomonadota bacterium]
MTKTASIVFTLILTFLTPAGAELVRVGLEPFPPLINADGSGYTIDVLRAIEKRTGAEFDIRIMSYRRAKIELKKGNIDLLGHTPWRAEQRDFYRYAQELQFRIPARIALFSLEEQFLELDELGKGRLGTPTGNADFMAEVIDAGLPSFTEAPLESLIDMLALGRIDAIVFAKGPVLKTLKQEDSELSPLSRVLVDDIYAGLAVQRTRRGDRLEKKLNTALKQIDLVALLEPYREYLAREVDQQSFSVQKSD